MSAASAWQALRDRHAWPAVKPTERPIDWSLDAGGRGMLVDLIRRRRWRWIVEIGVFLGGSVREWLGAHDEVCVAAIDPWLDGIDLRSTNHKGRQPEWVFEQAQRCPDGFYRSFLSSCWEFRDRIVPLRMSGVDGLRALASDGFRPDLIYLDADKSGVELSLAQTLFPGVALAGDDWYYLPPRSPANGLRVDYPIRRSVYEACARSGGYLAVDRSTWAILDAPPAWSQRVVLSTRHLVKSSVRRLKDTGRLWWRRRTSRQAASV
ncbi:MAG: hypothetical protein U0939_02140 [Pirellulales bacterium]